MNLFSMSAKYKFLMEKMELSREDLDQLDLLNDDIQEKAVHIAAVLKNMQAELNAVREAEINMHNRGQSLEKKITDLSIYLATNLLDANIEKVTRSPLYEIKATRNPPHLVTVNEQLIPTEFLDTKEVLVTQINKDKIKKVLLAGKEVPGAKLERRYKLTIK